MSLSRKIVETKKTIQTLLVKLETIKKKAKQNLYANYFYR